MSRKNTFLTIVVLVGCLILTNFLRKKSGSQQPTSSQASTAATTPVPQTSQDKSQESHTQTASAGSGSVASDDLIRSKADLLKNFPGEWVFHEPTPGAIRSVSGGLFKGVAKTPSEADAFIARLSPLLGARPEHVQRAREFESETPNSRIYRYEQFIDGYRVYQGEASLHLTREAGDVYIVNSSFRNIQSPQDSISLSSRQAEDALFAELKGQVEQVQLKYDQPVLFETGNGRSEFAWVFSADLKGSATPGAHEVVVSAVTGKSLYSVRRAIE